MAHTPRKAGTLGCFNTVMSPVPVMTPSQMIHTNKNGEILTWSSCSPHGLKFKQIYEDGCFKKKRAAQINAQLGDPFAQYATKTINFALPNCCRVKK
eukprot:7748366-Ditylum_brightwellii.AAC.1